MSEPGTAPATPPERLVGRPSVQPLGSPGGQPVEQQPVEQRPGLAGRTTVWKVGVPVTAGLSACFAVVTFLALFLSAFCGDGGKAGLPACLTAFWGLVVCTGLTMLIPLIFGVWGYRAVDNRQAGRRLVICSSGYLLPVGWFLGLLQFYFH
jgi:hypothetical protein